MGKLNVERLSLAIENRAQADIEKCNILGASLLVAEGDGIVYRNSFGFADSNGRKFDEGTLFRLASMTKPITAVAVMILVDRGILSLSDTVDKFYPKFKNMKRIENGELFDVDIPITMTHLLSHSSGVGSGAAWSYSEKRITALDYSSVESFVDFLSTQPLSFIPGTKQEYSGIASFSILTGIVQKITGMPYPEFLKKEIFDPCNMTDTTFTPTEEQWSRLVEMHNKVDGKNAVGITFDGCVFQNVPAENYLGGAGLVSSVSDYFAFAKMLLSGGEINGHRILSPESFHRMLVPIIESEAGESWGLGMRVITGPKKAPLPIGAFGWSGAYGTHFWIDPENNILAIYMKNSRFDGGSHAVTGRNFELDVYSALS